MIFGFPANTALRTLASVVGITLALTAIAAWYEFSKAENEFVRPLLATIEHSANSVPVAIWLTVLFDLGGHAIMIVREWLKEIHEEKRRLREEQFRDEGRQEGRREGKQEGRREGREEFRAEAHEWYTKKVTAEQSGTSFSEPPPWEHDTHTSADQ